MAAGGRSGGRARAAERPLRGGPRPRHGGAAHHLLLLRCSPPAPAPFTIPASLPLPSGGHGGGHLPPRRLPPQIHPAATPLAPRLHLLVAVRAEHGRRSMDGARGLRVDAAAPGARAGSGRPRAGAAEARRGRRPAAGPHPAPSSLLSLAGRGR
ncbi:hypothetical protein PVAP13_5KG300107 [Panicum virgatum]|uniref:Uncharacterized protein n=1 Tax=Panicum virgatum TaxID=38727 RepID=A0A8T0SHY4_PANVG|nr:hypothetical protein PVAP13_5KG300107 [Panicum virgatum]